MDRTALRLSDEERLLYREQGYFVRRRLFSPDELDALRDAAECSVAVARAASDRGRDEYAIDGNVYREAGGTTIQLEHRNDSETVRVLEPFHHLDPRFSTLLDDPRFVEPMCGLVGTRPVAVFTDKLNLKRPREGSQFRWHQDSPYWNHATPHVDRLPNAMLVLDDADIANGCLRMIPGSHRKGMLPGLEGDGTLGPLFTDPRYFDASTQVPVELEAGGMLFFSPHMVHGSQPNDSDRARRALIVTYQPAGHRMFKVDAKREAG